MTVMLGQLWMLEVWCLIARNKVTEDIFPFGRNTLQNLDITSKSWSYTDFIYLNTFKTRIIHRITFQACNFDKVKVIEFCDVDMFIENYLSRHIYTVQIFRKLISFRKMTTLLRSRKKLKSYKVGII